MDSQGEFLYEAFNIYYNKGVEAKETGNIREARRQLLLAAETLKKLADMSTGELKLARQERVVRLLEIVEGLDSQIKSNAGASTLKKSEDNKPNSTNKIKGTRNTDSTETQWLSAKVPNVHFSDIAGMEEVKLAVKRRIIYPRQHPEYYEKFKKKVGGGILMYGLPGTGKTMMAKAIAAEVGATFFEVKCSDIVSKWFGEAEKNIRNLFDAAREVNDAVIFFDEFEAIGSRRSDSESATNRIVPELLAQIQGFNESKGNLLVMAATNMPWNIDSALMRPGRFAERLYIPLPDESARQFLIEKNLSEVPLSPDVDFADLVYSTAGYNGSDIVELCEVCKSLPIERGIASGSIEGEMITQEDVEYAKKAVKSSVQQQDVILLERFKRGELT